MPFVVVSLCVLQALSPSTMSRDSFTLFCAPALTYNVPTLFVDLLDAVTMSMATSTTSSRYFRPPRWLPRAHALAKQLLAVSVLHHRFARFCACERCAACASLAYTVRILRAGGHVCRRRRRRLYEAVILAGVTGGECLPAAAQEGASMGPSNPTTVTDVTDK